MNPLSGDLIFKFCQQCDWVFESWLIHKHLFELNENKELNIAKSKFFTSRLSIITQEYSLQQISKLHDPAMQGNSLNLSIDFIVRFGGWEEEKEKIYELRNKLNELWSHIKPARNKTLSHNDLETIMDDSTLGAFPKGKDDQYFETLQEFVNIVYDKWFDDSYPLDDQIIDKIEDFLNLLNKA